MHSAARALALLLSLSGGAHSLSAWEQEVLDKHNELRALVANGKGKAAGGRALPTAANMAKMQWDAAIAAGAQQWADGCKMAHDPANGGRRLGENLSFAGGRSSAGGVFDPQGKSDHVQAWFDEIDVYTGDVGKFTDAYENGKAVGHFTQLVWAESTKLGCGYKLCPKGGILVCRYGSRPGNMLTAAVYKAGPPCGACAAGGACERGLCAAAGDDSGVETTLRPSGGPTTTEDWASGWAGGGQADSTKASTDAAPNAAATKGTVGWPAAQFKPWPGAVIHHHFPNHGPAPAIGENIWPGLIRKHVITIGGSPTNAHKPGDPGAMVGPMPFSLGLHPFGHSGVHRMWG